jgi:hypothetical protein
MLGHEINKRASGFLLRTIIIFSASFALSGIKLNGQNLSFRHYDVHSETFTAALKEEVSKASLPPLPLKYWFITPITRTAENRLAQKLVSTTDPAYSFRHLGAICKWEYRVEQSVQFPVKFRLGEYHYVQKLEGKSLHNE